MGQGSDHPPRNLSFHNNFIPHDNKLILIITALIHLGGRSLLDLITFHWVPATNTLALGTSNSTILYCCLGRTCKP